MLRRAIIMRPYSLEREFGGCGSASTTTWPTGGLAPELVGIASEFVAEPELSENLQTREAFVSPSATTSPT